MLDVGGRGGTCRRRFLRRKPGTPGRPGLRLSPRREGKQPGRHRDGLADRRAGSGRSSKTRSWCSRSARTTSRSRGAWAGRRASRSAWPSTRWAVTSRRPDSARADSAVGPEGRCRRRQFCDGPSRTPVPARQQRRRLCWPLGSWRANTRKCGSGLSPAASRDCCAASISACRAPASWWSIDPAGAHLARVDWDKKIRLWPFGAPADAEPILLGPRRSTVRSVASASSIPRGAGWPRPATPGSPSIHLRRPYPAVLRTRGSERQPGGVRAGWELARFVRELRLRQDLAARRRGAACGLDVVPGRPFRAALDGASRCGWRSLPTASRSW